MSEPADLVEEQDADGGKILRFTGTMWIAHITQLDHKLGKIEPQRIVDPFLIHAAFAIDTAVIA